MAKPRTGAPTKYRPEFAQRLIEFFSVEPYQTVEVKTTDKRTGRVYMNEELRAVRFPTLERFAAELEVNTDTLVEWASATYPEDYKTKSLRGKLKHPDFSAAYTRAKHLQKDVLVTNGLMGLYPSNFAIFVGTNFTDMKAKQDIDMTSKGERIQTTPVVISQIAARSAQAEPEASQSS